MVLKYEMIVTQVFVVIFLASNIASTIKSTKRSRSGYYLPEPTDSELKCYENIKSVFKTDTMGDGYRDCILFAMDNLTTDIVKEKNNKHAMEYYNFLGKNIVNATKDQKKKLMEDDESKVLTPKEFYSNESSANLQLLEKTYGTTEEDVMTRAYFHELVTDPDTMEGDDVVKFWYVVHLKQCMEINYDEILDPTMFCHKFHNEE